MKKNLFSLGLMTAAVITLASCAKEAAAPVAEEPASEGVPFEIVAGVGTKTAVSPVAGEAAAIEWEANDAVSLFVAEHDGEYSNNRKFTITADDLVAGRFTGTLAAALDPDKSYDWKVVYPWKSGFKLVNASGNGTFIPFGSQTNSSQTQDGNNNADHLAGSNMPLYGVVKQVAGNTTPTIDMHQAMSVIKVHVTNKANSALTVTSLSVTAPEETLINGTFHVDFSGDVPVYASSGPSYTSSTARLTVENGTAIAKNGSADFYIGVLPFTLASGNKLTVNINGADIEKTATQNTEFAAGVIKTVNVDYTGGVEYTSLTEIFTSSQGTGTYNIQNLLVYAKNNNSAILGDAAGVKILLYKNSHGLNVGETVDVTNAVIGTYNDNIQITNGTFTVKSTGTAVDHGNPWNLNDATTVAALPDESNFFSPIYAVMTGAQNGRVITGGTTLYLDVANAATDGKKVIFEGYVCSYEKANTRHRVLAIDLQERMTVSPTSLSWKADETDAKTITVVINDGGDGYTVTPTTDTNFTISDNGSGTITVTPKAKNTSTTDAKSVTLNITHKNDADVHVAVTCTQAKKPGTGPQTYSWTLASGDLGSSNEVASSVYVGTYSVTESTLTWTTSYTWKNDAAYLGWNADKGVQIGSGGNPVQTAAFTTTGFTGSITKIVVNASTAISANATLGVTVGGNALTCNDSTDPVALSTTATNYTFTGNATGTVVVTISQPSTSKALYLKSITFNVE